jgi:hypothetical protein
MGMRKSTRQELRKLRELVWEAYDGVACFFCHEPLLDGTNEYGNGNGDGTKTDSMLEITVHHKDGDHSNNEPRNRKPCHRRCHKSFHMAERWRIRKGGR